MSLCRRLRLALFRRKAIFIVLIALALLLASFRLVNRSSEPAFQSFIYAPPSTGVCIEPTGDAHLYGRRNICNNPAAKTVVFMQFSDWTLLDSCAIVTAAKRNPNYGICVLQAEGVQLNPSDLASMSKVENVQIVKLQARKLVSGTPLEPWYAKTCSKKPFHRFLTAAMSDGLRYVYLYKFGGVYLDTDCLTLKSFGNLTNVIGLVEDGWSLVNGAVMIFDRNNRFLKEAMEKYVRDVDPALYGSGGPSLLRAMFLERFREFLDGSANLVPPHVFYPLYHLDNNPKAFKRRHLMEVTEKYKDSITLHLSRSVHASMMRDSVEERSYIGEILRRDCEVAFDSSGRVIRA